MAERAPLQQVIRRIQDLRAQGKTVDEQVAEVNALGWRPEEVKERVGKLPPAGGLDVAAQTLSFGAADELSAGMRAPLRAWRKGMTLADAYEQALEESRAGLELYKAQSPIASTAMGIGSGFLLPNVGGPATTVAGAIGKGAGNAAIQGALEGAGTGEDPENRLERAGIGGGIGAVIGGGLGLSEATLRGLYSNVAPESTARQMVAEALTDEGLTPEQAANAIAAARAAGSPNTVLADIGQEGGRLQVLAKDVVNNPNRMQSPLRRQIGQRQEGVRGPLGEMTAPGQYERTGELLADVAGTRGRRAVATTAQIVARRQRDAGPLFRAANQFDPAGDNIVRRMITNIAQTPVFEDAWPRAVKIARSRAPGMAIPDRQRVIDGTAIPNMQFLHFLKEGMDDSVNAAYRAGDNMLGGALRENRNTFRETLKIRNPEYRTALDAFAGEMALEESLDEGRRLVMKSPDEMIAAINGMGSSEQEVFRIGALTEVMDVLGRSPRGPATDTVRKLKSPVFVRKMAALMPDDTARRRWFAFADAEEAKSSTAKAMYGSQTQSLQAADELMDDGMQAAEMLRDLGRGVSSGFWDTFVGAMGKVSKPIANALKARRRGAVGDIMSLTDQQAEDFLRTLIPPAPAGPRPAGTANVPPINTLPGYLLERLALPATTGVISSTNALPEARPINRDLGF